MKSIRMIMIIALSVVFILAAFSFSKPVTADNLDRYGYSLLTNDKQKLAYEAIADGISSLNPQIKFSCDGISHDDIKIANERILRDYPEFFWYDGSARISIAGSDVTFSPVAYKVNGQTVTADSPAFTSAKNQLEAAVNSALAKLPSNPSQYEIAHTFHDFVIDHVSYEMVGDHQTAYGALVTGKAVCAGYSRAFQLLMNRAGIRCWYVEGDSYDPSGALIKHAWNLYWLDGKCYYSDATWDDQSTELFHEYLNMSLEDISKTHFTQDQLPMACNHNDYTFFVKNDGKGVCDIRDHKDVKDVAKCFEIKSQNGDHVVYFCTIHYHGDDFDSWIKDNSGAIIQELDYKSVEKISIIELGHEHHVTISGQLKSAPKPTAPSEPTPTTKPIEPAPTTKPTEPAPTTKPTEPAPTTKPTEPAPTTKPTEPAPTTKPTEPASTTKPTDPVPTTKPIESAPTTTPTAPTHVSEPTEQTGTQTAGKPADPSGTSKPSSIEGTTQPTQSEIDTAGDSGKIVMIVAVCLAAAAGIGIAVYFFVIKKK